MYVCMVACVVAWLLMRAVLTHTVIDENQTNYHATVQPYTNKHML
jgi:hypothetical protein